MRSLAELQWWFHEGEPSLGQGGIDYVRLSVRLAVDSNRSELPLHLVGIVRRSQSIVAALRRCSRESRGIINRAYEDPPSESWVTVTGRDEEGKPIHVYVYRPDVTLLVRISTASIDEEIADAQRAVREAEREGDAELLSRSRMRYRELREERKEISSRALALLKKAHAEFVQNLRDVRAEARARKRQSRQKRKAQQRREKKALVDLRGQGAREIAAILRKLGVGKLHRQPSLWLEEQLRDQAS